MASIQVEQQEVEVDQGVEGYELLLAAGAKAPAPAATFKHGITPKAVDIHDLDKLAEEVRKLLWALKESWHGTSQDLGKVTRDIVQHFLYEFPDHNVMVVHPAHLASFHDSVKEGVDVPYAYFLTYHYSVYVFKRGTFTLLGDGGYKNWAFGGNFERNDKHVIFKDRRA